MKPFWVLVTYTYKSKYIDDFKSPLDYDMCIYTAKK